MITTIGLVVCAWSCIKQKKKKKKEVHTYLGSIKESNFGEFSSRERLVNETSKNIYRALSIKLRPLPASFRRLTRRINKFIN